MAKVSGEDALDVEAEALRHPLVVDGGADAGAEAGALEAEVEEER